MLGPLVSETFASISGNAAVTFQKSDGSRTSSSGSPASSIRFDAGSQSYILTVDGRSQTFRPADIDNALSTAQQVVYARTNGNTVDTLALTRPGTSGPLTYQYVGSAFWQRTTETSTTIGGTLDGFVYGVETLAGDVPITGTASYGFDIVGGGSYPDNIFGLSGTGNSIVNFGDGQMTFNGTAVARDAVGNNFAGQLAGNAQIASGSNGFSGNFTIANLGFDGVSPSLSSPLTFSGSLIGQFFGPDAAEFGAVLRSITSTSGLDAMVATLIGRQNPDGQNTSFADLLNLQGQTFTAQANTVTFNSNNQTGPATITEIDGTDLPVLLVPAAQQFTYPTYAFSTPDGLQVVSVFPTRIGVDSGYAGLRQLEGQDGWLQYASSDYVNLGRLVQFDSGIYTFTDFVFGFDTPVANLPSGNARYDISSLSALHFGPSAAPQVLGGEGRIFIDFATGMLNLDAALSGSGGPNLTGYQGAGLTGSASLGAQASTFAGTIDIEGANTLSGTWEGGIFGPDGAELAAIFSAGDASELLTGAFLAGLNPTGGPSVPALADLTEETTFNSVHNAIKETGGSPAITYGNGGDFQLVYNPAAGTYSFTFDREPVIEDTPAVFTPADLDATASDASFAVYHSADGAADLQLLKNEAGNPLIEMTYASFGQLSYRRGPDTDPLQNEYFLAFGSQTPTSELPLSGTATYTGVALGAGNVDGMGEVDVEGTMTATVYFGSIDLTTALSLVAIDRDGLMADLDLGTIEVDGQRFGSQILHGVRTSETGDFSIAGWFYGPNAEEMAGVWEWERDSFGNWTVPFAVQGVFGATVDD